MPSICIQVRSEMHASDHRGHTMLIYCYTLTSDTNGTNLIQYPDLPEGASVSEGEHDLQADASEGLEAVGASSVTLGALPTAEVFLSK
jgi:antitoxin HicB